MKSINMGAEICNKPCSFKVSLGLLHLILITGGLHLSHTVVKPDSHFAWIFVAKFSLYN